MSKKFHIQPKKDILGKEYYEVTEESNLKDDGTTGITLFAPLLAMIIFYKFLIYNTTFLFNGQKINFQDLSGNDKKDLVSFVLTIVHFFGGVFLCFLYNQYFYFFVVSLIIIILGGFLWFFQRK